ncbi:N-fatty-acyl-amino acid synthase/hydrolase PM20D1 isoform X1 [Parasteatoda tepidariorum]|uniref:N-fatty-acyl-amino acid synthase/hydrolase PM20D1 isoform X1 n=1 Tax=Parasteatoda tepidariorum TaxID=114398 RepID=UPI001C726AB2|nr:N-fatty-acyl-amino acid synthase/hydrolase PM20D1 [Parasteatoda tepidariorum]
MDVVPVEESYWEEEPFSGTIKDGYIWGRGTIDSKHIVMGTLEALEFLLEKGYKPKRSFYLAYGHDEESGGLDGAQYISQLLKSRNVELEYLLDEGSFVMDDFVPGITSPVALISVSEKGSLNLELKVRSIPGHSSFPSRETAIVILSKALSKLGGDIFPSMFGKGPEESLFEELAHCAPFPFKVVFKNLWLFKYPVIMYMSDPVMSAVHRTTVAVTIVTGGNKINVLPSTATANLNLRVHPAQTNNEALQFVKNTVRDERVEINVISQDPPHPFSPTDSLGYYLIRKTIRQIYNNSCVAPMTLIANTDSRWYLNLTRNVYRFSLIRMKPSELDRFHGHNERISVENYEKVVNFFLHLIKNSDDKPSSGKHSHNEL